MVYLTILPIICISWRQAVRWLVTLMTCTGSERRSWLTVNCYPDIFQKVLRIRITILWQETGDSEYKFYENRVGCSGTVISV